MTSEEFKARFIKALPDVPEELNLKLDEFSQFPESALLGYELRDDDRDFLCKVGFPRQAASFLSFSSYEALSNMQAGFFPIGSDGSGSNIGIELSSGNVILLDHDFGMKSVFINSSLFLFAECLCLFQEHLTREAMAGCVEALCQIDRYVNDQDGWWYNEVANA
ncbi:MULTISPECIES: SUKH-4 family immunity protein [unclassified Halomonas]|uniref:SUKH-4 family immunity protein n=1 Tax=unclassified Halomonas TaxID=2609666 RepID=UPI0007D9B545|nr:MULTISPECIES: SUKH-4 family immunity protein [unclassified Halomonas]MBT2788254.1 SUKH-4 family immunity protein [Halomonas sp. ISL-106]MBT2796003.1 SUKH-4 family immunity protein [Halomonas sp. ISL-104]OAL61273.1 hypothetical protein A6R74_16965 [Halomonas sp. ALS9]